MSAGVSITRAASQRGTALVADDSRPTRPFYANNGTTYTRPADWLTIPTLVPNTDRKIILLAAVFDNGSNLFALQCTTSSGTYTVDWGDGLGTVAYTSGTTASYNIAWANIGSGTLTSRGYRQALITITPTTGGASITQALFNVRGTNDTSTQGNPHMFLEASVCDIGLSRLTFGPESASLSNQAYNPMLEQVNLVQTAATIRAAAAGNNFDYMFSNCVALQSVVGTINGATTGTYSATGMFALCRSMRVAPSLNMPNCTFAVDMFLGCSALQQVDISNVSTASSVANWGQAFQNCISLQNAPRFPLDGANCESWSSTFNGCSALKNVPYINASYSSVSFFNLMFGGCTSLRTAPVIRFPTTGSYATTNMFSGCSSLETVPTYNLSRANSTGSMFNNCFNLKSYGNMTFAINTNASAMFNNCYSLTTVGTVDVGGQVCNISNMFFNCARLESFPGLLNSSAVTNPSSMFQGCSSLVSVGSLSFGAANMTNLFANCWSLVNAPAITITGAVTATNSMFSACYNLNSVPNYTWTFAASSTINSMFQNCVALVTPPSINTTNVINFTSMFSGCNSLTSGGSWNTGSATSLNGMFSFCQRLNIAPTFSSLAAVTNIGSLFGQAGLTEIPAYNFNAVNSAGNFNNAMVSPTVSRIQATGIRFSIGLTQCRLAGAQLDEIYTNLPTVTGQTITVTGNWGTATDTPSIATAKGWTVTGT